MIALHITLTDFRNESRILKETSSLINHSICDEIQIAALHSPDLDTKQSYTNNIHLNRFKLKTKNLNKNLISQILKYLEFCFYVFKFYRKKEISFINIHSLGLLPLGIFLKLAYKSKLIYDTHELETEKNNLAGFRKKICKWLERKLIKYVDMTLVVSESIADWYEKEYTIRRPVVILNSPRYRKLKTNNYFREQLGISSNQIIFLYQGGLVSGRGTNFILEAFKQRSDNKAVIVFMGYGDLEKDIQQAAEEFEHIYFYPAVSPDVVLEYTASADVGIHLIQNTCLNHYYCMPNKLFEYSMAGLPVIVSNMKDMSNLVQHNKMGEIIEDFTPISINQTIDRLLSKDLAKMKANAYKMATTEAWEHQEKKMLLAYKELSIE